MLPEKQILPAYPLIERKDFEDDPTRAVKGIMAARRDWFSSAMVKGFDALEISHAYSDIIDEAVRTLFEISTGKLEGGGLSRSAVLALGGYGRGEMGISTDIDLLFLIGDDDEVRARAITDGILYPFWDSGIEVGGATRTLDDCRAVMDHEARALTAMMDARLIAGNESLLEELRTRLSKHFSSRSRRKKFIDDKIAEHRTRLERYGGSIYLLQPNLKEGEGGLRELHTLRWVASAARHAEGFERAIEGFVPEGASRCCLRSSHRFLWAVRHVLHLIDSSTNDRLSEAAQRGVAQRLGYSASGRASAEESFMSDYYMHAEGMHLICERGIEMVRREMRPPSRARAFLRRRIVPGGIKRTEFGTLALRNLPECVDALTELNLFATSRRSGNPIDPITKGALGTATSCDLADIGSFVAMRTLRDIFQDFRNLERTLLDMHECGALVRWFPEMAPMFHLIQHDGLHYYTAGVHSIKAVGEIATLSDRRVRRVNPIPGKAFSRVRRKHVLALATLFHDVGKGRGGGHSEKGALLAADIARRMGYGESDVRDIEYLVRSHLLMSTLAFRRDIHDPELIEKFAQSIHSPEVLAMLYLLTFGDIRAIGPNIWSGWKGALLGKLYEETHAYMTEKGGTTERRRRVGERIISSVLGRVGSDADEDYVKGYIAKLPERYIHSMPAETIAAHILLARNIGTNPLSTFIREVPERGCVELSVVTKDSPGLFAKIAGVLAANSANIVDAQIYTSTDGVAIDVIWVTDAAHGMLTDPIVWSRIRGDLGKALDSEGDADRVVGERFKRRVLDRRPVRRPTEISVENDVSALHTVIEVRTDDRRGLLYLIASTFHDLDCTIDLARITTHVDRVIDVFYIRDAGGQKISAKERLGLIREKLIEALQ